MLRVLVVIVAMVAVLAAVYIALGLYARWRAVRRLEAEHAAGKGRALTREDYVQRGLAEFDRSVPRKLMIAVLAAPILVFIGLALLVNYS